MIKRVRFDPLIIKYRKNHLKFPLLETAINKMSRVFYTYGKFCASRPWEVMISFLTVSICLFSLSGLQPTANENAAKQHETICPKDTVNCNSEEDSIDAVYVIMIARCLAVLYTCHSFSSLYKLGSKYLMGIAVLFSLFSSFFFCTGVINFLNTDFNKLWRALTFFYLLMDLPKAVLLAQYALSSKSREDISENIAQGMVVLGPTLTLDTSLKLLSIGIGTISKVGRMEELIYFAFLSVIVNYIIFMIFLPACLSLALELSHDRDSDKPSWQLRSLGKVWQVETERATNPVIQRVKLIMSVGLMLIHIISRWPISDMNDSLLSNSSSNALNQLHIVNASETASSPTGSPTAQDAHGRHAEASFFEHQFHKWFTVSFEQVVLFGLVFVLITKYIYDSKENLEEEVRAHQKSTATNEKSLSPQRNAMLKFNKKVETSNGSVATRKISPAIVITETESQTLCKSLSKSPEKVRKSSLKSGNRKPDEQSGGKFFIGASADDTGSDTSDDVELADKEVQTDESNLAEALKELNFKESKVRELSLLVDLLNSEDGLKQLTDDEILVLVEKRKMAPYKLESILGDPERGVKIRRMFISKQADAVDAVHKIPYTNYDYSLVMGACCENVIGFMPVPLGVAGPLLLDGEKYQVPMATTEGCLIASTNRGCRALFLSGGVSSSIYGDCMTRGPVVSFPSACKAVEASNWVRDPTNYQIIKLAFDSTSRFARLENVLTRIAGNELFIRFSAQTGDAMGMNMISKGTELALLKLQEFFPDMEIVSLSGNFCTDKKPSAVNWIEGRGKSVVCEATLPAKVVKEVLKTDAKNLTALNISKNMVGSAVAGSIGGYNAQAANIVAAIYIATGQDPAQVVGSSNCMTQMKAVGENCDDLYITCTMPSVELGTIGGGTILTPQASCLELIRVKGSCQERPGENARTLARIVCATVLAAELSLLSALETNTLVKSHMKHNRSSISINASSNSLITHASPPTPNSTPTFFNNQHQSLLSPNSQ